MDNTFVNIREYYKDGEKLVSRHKGITLSLSEWENLKASINDIDRDIKEQQT